MKKFTKNIADMTPGLFINDTIKFEDVSDQQNITNNPFRLRLKARKQLQDTVKSINVPPVIQSIEPTPALQRIDLQPEIQSIVAPPLYKSISVPPVEKSIGVPPEF